MFILKNKPFPILILLCLEGYLSGIRYSIHLKLEYGQVVRQAFLVRPFIGSNPITPETQYLKYGASFKSGPTPQMDFLNCMCTYVNGSKTYWRRTCHNWLGWSWSWYWNSFRSFSFRNST